MIYIPELLRNGTVASSLNENSLENGGRKEIHNNYTVVGKY